MDLAGLFLIVTLPQLALLLRHDATSTILELKPELLFWSRVLTCDIVQFSKQIFVVEVYITTVEGTSVWPIQACACS